MKQTISKSQFKKAFYEYNRGDNFSPAGLAALYDYLTDLERDTGEEYELDVIALCCDFSEYTTNELREAFPEMAAEAGDDDRALFELAEEQAGHFILVDDDRVILNGWATQGSTR